MKRDWRTEYLEKLVDDMTEKLDQLEKENEFLKNENRDLKNTNEKLRSINLLNIEKMQAAKNMEQEYAMRLAEVKILRNKYKEEIKNLQEVKRAYSSKFKELIKEINKK